MFDNTKKKYPHYLQLDAMDCGPTCLRMIAKYYGKNYSLQTLHAGHQCRGGIHRFPYIRGAYYPEATGGRHAAAVHPALEPEPLRGVL